jgi:hypothetical protein
VYVWGGGTALVLDGEEILLGAGKVARLEIGGELVESLGYGVRGGGRGSGGRTGGGLRKAFCKVAKSDRTAERLPDVRSWLSCWICFW